MVSSKRTKTSDHATATKKESKDTSKTKGSSSELTHTQKSSSDEAITKQVVTTYRTSNKEFIALRPATRADLRHISQLVQLCDIVICSTEAYLHIWKLAKDQETQETNDLRTLKGSRQFNHITEVLDNIADAIQDTIAKMRESTLTKECEAIPAYRALMAGVDRVHRVVLDVLGHAKAAKEAKRYDMGLPGDDVVVRIGEVWEELVALQQGPVGGSFRPWDECVDAVESTFQHLH